MILLDSGNDAARAFVGRGRVGIFADEVLASIDDQCATILRQHLAAQHVHCIDVAIAHGFIKVLQTVDLFPVDRGIAQ